MARKKKEVVKTEEEMNPNTHILGAGTVLRQNITETLETNYMPYAMSVILSRAIPEIDGFFGASSIERFAAERGIKAQAAAFKAITR